MTKNEIVTFDGKNNFCLWHVKMQALLVQRRLLKALQGKEVLPATLSNDEKVDLLKWGTQCHSILAVR